MPLRMQLAVSLSQAHGVAVLLMKPELSSYESKPMLHGAAQAAGGEILEEIEESKAFWEVYDGAVYMFQVSSEPPAYCILMMC